MKLLSELKLVLENERSLLNQKARVSWLEQGNTNTKYFHSRIRWRRIKNELKRVDLNGSWCEDPCKVREEVRQVFVKHFSTPKYFSFNLQNIDFPTISNKENMLLTKDISNQEI